MEKIVQKFHEQGFRVTRPTQDILEVLTHFPQSAAEICQALKRKKKKIDPVTVYRTLDRCTKVGIVNRIQFKDKILKYELYQENHHHHHLVCDHCGSVEDVLLNEKYLLKKISQKTKFKIQSHALEFFGLCTKCQ